MTGDPIQSVGLLGFGEVGQTLAANLGAGTNVRLCAFDRLFGIANSAPERAMASASTIERCPDAKSLARESDLVICAVTASEDRNATADAARGLAAGTFFLDVNSVSPESRLACKELIEEVGGRYVEAAIMTSIGPRGIESPMLLGGEHAEAFLEAASRLGFTGASLFSPDIGPASATKMCRSVLVKGLEALFTESLLAARHYGVEGPVLASLDDLLAETDWSARAQYMISRSLQHGVRRAEEMQQVAATVADAGLDPWMSKATLRRQNWAAQFTEALGRAELEDLLDAIRSKL